MEFIFDPKSPMKIVFGEEKYILLCRSNRLVLKYIGTGKWPNKVE